MQCCRRRQGGSVTCIKGGGRGQRWQGAAVADGEVALLLAEANARCAFGGNMAMGSVSNIEDENKMIIALEGQTHAVRLGAGLLKCSD